MIFLYDILYMNESLLNKILVNKPLINELLSEVNYEKEWKKTLIYKITFGKLKPSKSWKEQLDRIYLKKITRLTNLISEENFKKDF